MSEIELYLCRGCGNVSGGSPVGGCPECGKVAGPEIEVGSLEGDGPVTKRKKWYKLITVEGKIRG